ncbi:MAG: tetratricopeptide repeat protein, partial [Coleofasciculus sp. C2-GNP5-27]
NDTEGFDLQDQLTIPVDSTIQREARNQADVLLRLGGEAKRQENLQKAIAYWQQALDLYQKIGDFEGQGLAYNYMGLAYADLGRFPQAEESLRRRLGVARFLQDFQGQIYALNNVGTVLLQSNDLDAAQESFTEALTIARTVGDREGEGLSL